MKTTKETIGHYLPELVYGANDGIITTIAVISGVYGANLPAVIALILGLANLFADAFSMGSSNYLSIRSQKKQRSQASAIRHSVATFIGFLLAGSIPLIGYTFPIGSLEPFRSSLTIALIALFMIGASRSFFTRSSWLKAGMEMLLIGSISAFVAYGVGELGQQLIMMNS